MAMNLLFMGLNHTSCDCCRGSVFMAMGLLFMSLNLAFMGLNFSVMGLNHT